MSITAFGNGGFTIDGKHIPVFRLMVLRSGLKLELHGIRMNRGRTAYSIIKQEFGLKGSREKVLEQFGKLIEDAKREAEAANDNR